MIAYWLTQQEHGGFPLERAALGSCDLSVLHIGGEWQWLASAKLAAMSPKVLREAFWLANGHKGPLDARSCRHCDRGRLDRNRGPDRIPLADQRGHWRRLPTR
jgi:hypothetical protein